MRRLLYLFSFSLCCVVVYTLTGCARMGQPDGGWYDEVPPRIVSSTPGEKAVNVTKKRVTINFNEFIKVDNPTENIVFCPPQIEQPDVKTTGKSIVIDFKDSLKTSTTYTIDFSDAIKDNNEGNPMGNYTYVFSTGSNIDTLEVSGYVLDAETLEPLAGSLVGLYSNLADSAFQKEPMLRVGRTDATGHFVIRGIAYGQYRVYSLMDSDGDYKFSQRSEQLGFNHDVIIPSSRPDTYQDTTWIDSLHIADIKRVPYTHFLPDDICLRAFLPKMTDRYLVKTERAEPNRFSVYFSYGHDSLPQIRPLNFNGHDAYIVESNARRDSITYWLRDTTLINQDTLRLEMSYLMTDTLGCLVQQTDTVELLPKISYEKRQKLMQDKIAKWEKKAEKERKKGKEYREPRPDLVILEPKISSASNMKPTQNVTLSFDTPLERFDTAMIHLYSKIDTLWYRAQFEVEPHGIMPRTYTLRAEWRPGVEYSLEVDSAAFCDIYGAVSDAKKVGIKIASEEEFSSLFVNVPAVKSDSGQVVVYLLDSSGKNVAESIVRDGTAEFYYVKPDKYFISVLVDDNMNGEWDTGDYEADLQPERVYFRPEPIECKAKWDVTTTFDVTTVPLYEQKPRSLVKAKGEAKKRTIVGKNLKRANDLGKKFDAEKVNSKF